ncbi:MAG: hypothetical protein WBU92_01085 [Candidatus Dormiibacterota bacterium]
MSGGPVTLISAEELAGYLYQALAASGHAGYCGARFALLYDETAGRWSRSPRADTCICGRDAALARYEEGTAARAGR